MSPMMKEQGQREQRPTHLLDGGGRSWLSLSRSRRGLTGGLPTVVIDSMVGYDFCRTTLGPWNRYVVSSQILRPTFRAGAPPPDPGAIQRLGSMERTGGYGSLRAVNGAEVSCMCAQAAMGMPRVVVVPPGASGPTHNSSRTRKGGTIQAPKVRLYGAYRRVYGSLRAVNGAEASCML